MRPSKVRFAQLQEGLGLLVLRDRVKQRFTSMPWCTNVSEEHAVVVFRLARELSRQGVVVVVEASFSSGGRADIYLPELFTIIEVLHSETVEKLQEKVLNNGYGSKLRVGWLTTDEAKGLSSRELAELAVTRAGVQRIGSL